MSTGHARILVVEDNETLRRGIAIALREAWGEIDEEATGEGALERIAASEPYDVVVTDLRLPGAEGTEVLRAARERDSRTSVLLMTAYGSIETAVDAMKAGAFDFLQKPVELEQIELRVARGVEQRRLLREVCELRAEQAGRIAAGDIIGESAEVRAAVGLALRVAPTRSTVLVTGETGTGKELIAGLVHRASRRADGPFVEVNCAALPETLLESELFGHERGAFTGADRQRIGRFEQASGGTLFLDEIGEMSPATQAKLLRLLQDQEFHRLGGTSTLRTDARIVAATNRDLEAAIDEGRFRRDLYFRLNVIRIEMPPLRDRPEDVLTLAHYYLERFAGESGRPLRGFTEGALARLRGHPWPGNVRELSNAIERAVLLTDGPRVRTEDVALIPPPGMPGPGALALPAEGVALRDVERELVLQALDRTGFVQKEAAALLGVSRRKLNYMIGRMGITHPTWRRHRAPGDGAPGAAAASEAPRAGFPRREPTEPA